MPGKVRHLGRPSLALSVQHLMDSGNFKVHFLHEVKRAVGAAERFELLADCPEPDQPKVTAAAL